MQTLRFKNKLFVEIKPGNQGKSNINTQATINIENDVIFVLPNPKSLNDQLVKKQNKENETKLEMHIKSQMLSNKTGRIFCF